jgi:hypothetical protein
MNVFKNTVLSILTSLVVSSAVLASTIYGPVNLLSATTISSTTWKTVLTQTVNVTGSTVSCYNTGDPFYLEICSSDNYPHVSATVKDAGSVNNMKYRFLMDGGSMGTPTIVDNGNGSVTITSLGIALDNGNHTFKLQIGKRISGSPTSVIDPSTGDAAQMSVTMDKP